MTTNTELLEAKRLFVNFVDNGDVHYKAGLVLVDYINQKEAGAPVTVTRESLQNALSRFDNRNSCGTFGAAGRVLVNHITQLDKEAE